MVTKISSRAVLFLCTAFASTSFIPSKAFAQAPAQPPAPEATPEADDNLAPIVVTAQKREQNLQDVPVAVTSIGQDVLTANRITNLNDINGLAPSLTSRQNAGSLGSPSYVMRGSFSSASVAAQDREISSYVDGVYLGATRGATFDLPDLERIEVLRGPQGTLFGRNATSGAISIVTRDPNGKFGLRQEVTVGNYAQLRTRTTVDLPQMGIFSAYVTYVHDEKRGDVQNLGAGTVFTRNLAATGIGTTVSPKWLGSKNNENVFVALKLAPSTDFSLTYKFDWSHDDNTPEARATVVINPNDFIGGLFTAIVATQPTSNGALGASGGSFGAVPFFPNNQRPKAVNNAWTMPGYVYSSGHNLTMNWKVSDNISIKNVAAYRQSKVLGISSIMGLDGLVYTAAAKAFYNAPQAALGGASYAQLLQQNGSLPVGSYFAGYEGNSGDRYWQASDELQANYQSDFLTLTAGAIWFHSREHSDSVKNMEGNPGFKPVLQDLALGNVQNTLQVTTSIAAYAQAEFHLTPKLDAVVGARVTHDKKLNALTLGGTYSTTLNTLTGESVTERVSKKTKPTYSAGLNYKVNDDVLVFGKFSTAFLSGGSAGPLTFAPETVASWELGLKSEWLDRRIRFNLAAYAARYKHIQSAQSGQNVVVNGQSLVAFGVVVVDNGTLDAKGIEAELNVVPFKGMTLGGSYSYTDPKLKSPSPLVTQGRPTAPGSISKVMASANAQYVTPALFGDATMLFRIDAVYQGKFRNSPFLDLATKSPVFVPYEFNPGRWIVNARVALRKIPIGPVDGEIAVWSRNLTNNKDATSPLMFGATQFDSGYQTARTIGVDFIVKY